MVTRSFIAALGLLACVAGAAPAQEPPRAAVKPLFAEMMAEWPGKQVRAFLVEFPPGGQSVPHTHAGPIFVYVLSGTWIMQLEGAAETTVKAGEVAYERANTRHLVSRNPSATEPLRLLVFYISDPGAGVSLPLAK